MKKYPIYLYWNKEKNEYIKQTTLIPDQPCLILYTLISDPGKYLYNINTNLITNATTIPINALNDWEERAYN